MAIPSGTGASVSYLALRHPWTTIGRSEMTYVPIKPGQTLLHYCIADKE